MRTTVRRWRRTAAVLAVATGALLGACSSGSRPELAEEPESTTTTTEATTTTTEAPDPVRAQAKGESIAIYPSADAAEPERELTAAEATSAPGIPIVFLVKDETTDRVEVYLPVRPNGSTGWVDKADVDLAPVRHRIEVEIAAHVLRVYDRDTLLLEEPVGVGREDRPTPGGVYYIKELLQPPNPNGPYGVYAYGLNGFSNVLESFNGGQGVIGIHGTNEPDKIGQDVSSGCIRLHNDVITRLVEEIGLPLGTPVEILA